MYNIISVGWSSMQIVIMNGIYKHFYFEIFNGNSTNHNKFSKKFSVALDPSVILLVHIQTGMRRITTFRSTTDRI